jgi:hemolysin III
VDKGPQSKRRPRDPVNGLTHLAGGLLASAGLFVLLAKAASTGRVDQLVAFGVFGLSLVALYLGMGWVAVVAAPALLQALPAWVLAGGLIYSAGALVYGFKRPNLIPGAFWFHEVWHLFVVAGCACHFWAVLSFAAPLA